MDYTVYTDGAYNSIKDIGAYAYVIIDHRTNNEIRHSSRIDGRATSNRAEMLAAIEALKRLPDERAQVRVISDSQLLVLGAKLWMKRWKANGWSRAQKKSKKVPPLNLDLWKEIDMLDSKHNIDWVWVRGHSGDYYNELCDRMANRDALLDYVAHIEQDEMPHIKMLDFEKS